MKQPQPWLLLGTTITIVALFLFNFYMTSKLPPQIKDSSSYKPIVAKYEADDKHKVRVIIDVPTEVQEDRLILLMLNQKGKVLFSSIFENPNSIPTPATFTNKP